MKRIEAIKKSNETINNNKRKTILENRIVRLEKAIKNELYAGDPRETLLDAIDNGYISWEELCRELLKIINTGEANQACVNLDLLEEDELM